MIIICWLATDAVDHQASSSFYKIIYKHVYGHSNFSVLQNPKMLCFFSMFFKFVLALIFCFYNDFIEMYFKFIVPVEQNIFYWYSWCAYIHRQKTHFIVEIIQLSRFTQNLKWSVTLDLFCFFGGRDEVNHFSFYRGLTHYNFKTFPRCILIVRP